MHQPPTPNLVLPCDAVANSQSLSQSQPLCTPLDRPILQTFASAQPPSPVRKPHGRHYHHQAASSSAASLSQSQYQHGTQQPQQAALLPEMSQDTLALFPLLVTEHAAQTQTGPPQSATGFGITNRPPKHPTSANTLGLAKASMLATLHMHPPLRNPYNGQAIGAISTVAKSGASESFDAESMDGVGEMEPARSQRYGTHGRKEVASLKTSIVASTQPQSSLLHFTQTAPPLHTTFSTISKAISRIDGVSYALKRNLVPFSTTSEKMSALQEVFALAALQNVPNVLRYHTSWWESGGKYLVVQCEWVENGCVSGKLPLSELCKLGLSLATVLACMHDRGMVHLDVKPDNIFVGQRDGDCAYILADYGLARKIDKAGAATSATIDDGYTDGRSLDGDSRYLCPEGLDAGISSGSPERPSAPYCHETSTKSDAHGGKTSEDEADRAPDRSLISPFSPAALLTSRPLKRRRRSRLTSPQESDDESFSSQDAPHVVLSSRQTGLRFNSASDAIDGDSYSTSDRDRRPIISPVKAPVSFMDASGTDAPDSQSQLGARLDVTDIIDCSNVNIDDNRDDDEDNDCGNSPVVQLQQNRAHHQSNARQTTQRPCDQQKITPARDLRAADIFSLGATLFELATGEHLPASGARWHWLRAKPDDVFKLVLASTNSRKFAQIVRECLTPEPLARPSAASLTAKIGSIDPHQSALTGARAQVRALQAHNAALRNALSQLVGAENPNRRKREKNAVNMSVEAPITRGQSARKAAKRPRGNINVPRDKRGARKSNLREHRLQSRSPVAGIASQSSR
jgi:serine/threonine protein kinase